MSGNLQQHKYWNGQAGETWTSNQVKLDRMLSPLSAEAVRIAAAMPGERVIDIGCGCGDTSIALAGTGAVVQGIDLSKPMLSLASQRAQAMQGVSFTQADAAVVPFAQPVQLLFSRFGVMFFEDPIKAFRHLHGGLSKDGRLVFICWQKPTANPWMSLGGRALQPFLPAPASPPDPRAPGPFAFSDPAYVEEVLVKAGFNEIVIEPLKRDLKVADTLDEALTIQGQVGPAARAMAELSGDDLEKALDAVRQVLQDHMSDQGLWLGSAVWLVSARF